MAALVLTLGDLVADLVVPIDSFPVLPDQHQIAHDIQVEAGGTGNFLVTAMRLGMRTRALGVIGQDIFGEHVLGALRQEGVELDYVMVPENSRTTTSIVMVDPTGRHVFVWMRGTGQRQSFRPEWHTLVAQADAIFTTGYALLPGATFDPQAVLVCMDIAREHQIPVFFDLGPSVAQLEKSEIDAVVRRATVFMATSEELASYTGISDPRQAARNLLGPALIVVKLGALGSLLMTATQEAQVEAFPVVVRNTAGAGDTFSAACVYGYLNQLPLRQIGLLANAVGAAAVAKIGTGVSLPQIHEVVQILQQHGHTFFTEPHPLV